MKENKQRINSLGRGLRILDILHEKGKVGVTELSKLIGVNKSSSYRLLATLEEFGYVEQIYENGKYALGLKLSKFQEKVLSAYEIRVTARPFLERLAETTGEASGLSIFKNDEVVLIDCCKSPQHIGVNLYMGDCEDINCTAHGKAMLFALPEDKQRQLLEREFVRFTPNTIIDKDAIIADAKVNKERGYALDNEEKTLGMRCVAANVYDYSKAVVAAIGISGPTTRVHNEKMPELIKNVTKIAEQLSKKLGY